MTRTTALVECRGCPVFFYKKSAERPASASPVPPFPAPAANDEDGKDHVSLSVQTNGDIPSLAFGQTFDLLIPIHISLGTIDCYLYGSDPHLADDAAAPSELLLPISLPLESDGELQAQAGAVSFPNLALNSAGCGALGGSAGLILNVLTPTLTSLIAAKIQPSIELALQAAVPKPAGAAGVFDLAARLKPYAQPAGVNLEFLALAGGYVTAAKGGLNVGVIAGMNSDADETTRTPDVASEPSPCAPKAVVPDLRAPP